MANRLYVPSDVKVKVNFLRVTEDYFRATIEVADFHGNPEQSRKAINNWVFQKTGNTMEELLPTGSITNSTVLVLAIAISFESSWLYRFTKDATKPFRLSLKKSVKVPMVKLVTSLPINYFVSRQLRCEVLELRLLEENTSMFLFVPDNIDGLAGVEARLNANYLDRVLRSLTRTRVNLQLPKLSLKNSVDLKPVLQRLGLGSLFETSRSNLSGINAEKRLVVTSARHQAILTVHNDVRSATTLNTTLSRGTGKLEDIQVVVDRPFLFMIVDRSTGCIVFLGRISRPNNRNVTVGAF